MVNYAFTFVSMIAGIICSSRVDRGDNLEKTRIIHNTMDLAIKLAQSKDLRMSLMETYFKHMHSMMACHVMVMHKDVRKGKYYPKKKPSIRSRRESDCWSYDLIDPTKRIGPILKLMTLLDAKPFNRSKLNIWMSENYDLMP